MGDFEYNVRMKIPDDEEVVRAIRQLYNDVANFTERPDIEGADRIYTMLQKVVRLREKLEREAKEKKEERA
jgi:hypothetical protein